MKSVLNTFGSGMELYLCGSGMDCHQLLYVPRRILKGLLSRRRSALKTQIHSYTYVHTVCLHVNNIKLCFYLFSVCLFVKLISLVNGYVSLKCYIYLLLNCLLHWLSMLKFQTLSQFILGLVICYIRLNIFVSVKQFCIKLETTLKCRHYKLICNSGLFVTYRIIIADIGLNYYLLGGKRYIIQIYYITDIYGY